MRIGNVKAMLLGSVTARMVAVSLCSVALGGCAGLTAYDPLGTSSTWHQYATPRAPENSIEEAVVQVAESRKNTAASGSEILYIADDTTKEKPVHCVDVVSGPVTKGRYPEKTVVRYRIVDGGISAMTDPKRELFLDAEFERAILKAVSRTWSPDPVILYSDGTHAMTIASRPLTKCTADVAIFDGDTLTDPIASKTVAFCFAM